MAEIDREVIQQTIDEIDKLLAMRQGFVDEYRDWHGKAMERLRQTLDEETVNEFERKGPRQTPVNRQHRVHIYRQRLHAQRKFLLELMNGDAS